MFFLHKDKPKDDDKDSQAEAPATAPTITPTNGDDDQTPEAPDMALLEQQVHALANGHPVPTASDSTDNNASVAADNYDTQDQPLDDTERVDAPTAQDPEQSAVATSAPVPAASSIQNEEESIPPITGESTVAQWLDHPVGGVIFRNMLQQSGQNESVVRIVRHMKMQKLVSMSGGRFTDEMLADMVQQANSGRAAAQEAAAQAAPASDIQIPTGQADISSAASQVDSADDNRSLEEPASDDATAEPTTAQTSTDSSTSSLPLPPVAAAVPTPPAKPAEWQETITPDRFTGKTIVVTGAGSGIGKATASRIAREGGRVIAVDISEQRLQELKTEFDGLSIETVAGDITSEGTIATIINTAGDTIDGLANVAGVMDNMTPLHEMSDDVWTKVMNVNLNGLMRLTRAALPLMVAKQQGTIVNVSSEAGLKGSAAGTAYTTSKHAVIGLSKSLAFMYGPSGIRTNVVAPGPVATNIQASFDSELGSERVNSIFASMPPVAEASHLAASITFLLSDDSVNINGAILPSDNGWSVQ